MSKLSGKIEAVGAVANLLSFFFDRESINVAKAKAAIDAAEKYMMVNEGDSHYSHYTEKKRARYLRHYKKRFIHYN